MFQNIPKDIIFFSGYNVPHLPYFENAENLGNWIYLHFRGLRLSPRQKLALPFTFCQIEIHRDFHELLSGFRSDVSQEG